MVGEGPGADGRRQEGQRRGAAAGSPRVLPADRGSLQGHRGQRRRGRGRARAHDREPPSPAAGRGAGPSRHRDLRDPVHRAVQRQLGAEPDPRALPGARLPVQHVSEQADRPRGRRCDPVPPGAVGVQHDPPPELHRLLRRGARGDHRPEADRGDVRGALRARPVVHPPVPDVARLPRCAPVLHVVLGSARARSLWRRDLRRRRAEVGGAARLPPRRLAPRRVGDGEGYRRVRCLDHVLPRAADHDRGRAMSARDELRELARGFRWGRRPLVPRSAEPYTEPHEDAGFPTDWARSKAGVAARRVILRGGMLPIVSTELSLRVYGTDHLEDVPGPVIFYSNHLSHLDATLIMCTLPERWQKKTGVGAARDYFFDVWWRQAFTALVYGGFPIDRGRGGETAVTQARGPVGDGGAILLFPQGARAPPRHMQRV